MTLEITVLVVAAITLVASFVQGLTGFGFGIMAMIFLPSFLIFTEANVYSSALSTVVSLIIMIAMFKKINWKNLIFPFIGSIVANYGAIIFVKTAAPALLKLLLGVLLFILSVYFFFFSEKVKIRATWKAGLIAGLVSGVLSGLFSIGGPPVVIYYMQSEEDTDGYLATISAYFVLTGAVVIAMKAISGFITQTVLICMAVGLIAMLLGYFFGKRTRDKANPQLIKKVVYAVMAISGLSNIISFFA